MKVRNANAGLAADQAGVPAASLRVLLRQARELPNILTLLRIAMVPVFVVAHAAGHARLALALFAAAAVTDGLDGLLARALHRRTELGGMLDPAADKLLALAALWTLTLAGRLPPWLAGLVLVRDLGIAAAVAALRTRGHPVPVAPTRLGKYATFLLALTLVLALAREVADAPALADWEATALVLAGACVLLVIVQYSAAWRRLMRAPVS
jgi:cardiolipin synthase